MRERTATVGTWLGATAVIALAPGFRCPGREPSLLGRDPGAGGFVAAGGAPVQDKTACERHCDRIRACEPNASTEDCLAICEAELDVCGLETRSALETCYEAHFTGVPCVDAGPLLECLEGLTCFSPGTGGAPATTATSGVGGAPATTTTTATSGGGFPPDVVAFCSDTCDELQNHPCILDFNPPSSFDASTCQLECSNAVQTCVLPNPALFDCIRLLDNTSCALGGPACLFTNQAFSCVTDKEAYLWVE